MSSKIYTAISTMKNEGPFILEWVAHYKTLGFDHLVICTNDCEDTTVDIIKALEKRGLVSHRATKIWDRAGIQRSALKQARRHDEVKTADWIFVCDADEFLNIKVGDGSVRALVAAHDPDTDVIEVPWRVFGPDGTESFLDQPVTEQFLMCEDPDDTRIDARRFCKSVFTGLSRFKRIGIHQPIARPEFADQIKSVYPNGKPVGAFAETREDRDFDVAQVNHYALRSLESFLVKRARGRVNHSHHVMGLHYWERFNINHVADTSIRRYDAQVAEWRDRFFADLELKALHDQSVAWYHTKIAALRGDPGMQPLIDALKENLTASSAAEG